LAEIKKTVDKNKRAILSIKKVTLKVIALPPKIHSTKNDLLFHSK
jgi:hypothetical protein